MTAMQALRHMIRFNSHKMMKFLPITVFLYVIFQVKLWFDLYKNSNMQYDLRPSVFSMVMLFISWVLVLYTRMMLPKTSTLLAMYIVGIAVTILHLMFSMILVLVFAEKDDNYGWTVGIGTLLCVFSILSFMEWVWIESRKLKPSVVQSSDVSTETHDTSTI